ncbi:MAG: 3-dehydroquinate synthase [Prevotellaceae bacterium]|jgi:3-dehydroquinate synthase|nr:3-dehydroquinate synthase [Prevotellaceae bacterium]
MQTIEIKTAAGKRSKIFIGEDFIKFQDYLPVRKAILIIDENIFALYGSFFKNFQCIKIQASESNKTLKTVENIILKLVEYQIDRAAFIVGVGGGITCDIAGFTASVYTRGLPFGFISTSLLSQADASVGGKNGINFCGLKNMIGTFNQPEFVICDTNMLDTLPQKEFLCGLSEIIKIALIKDAGMFNFIENKSNDILKRNKTVLQKLITKSIQHKADIVVRDEFEKGERRILNFGHTLAHAIEANDCIPHGFAVSIGIMFAAKISKYFGLISSDIIDSIEHLLVRLGLPCHTDIDDGLLLNAVIADKKKNDDEINFVLLDGEIGKATEKSIKINTFKTLISAFK